MISGSSGLNAEPRLRAGTMSMTGLKFCKRVLKKSPTRPATSAELSSKPAGVSIMATRNGSELRRAKDSKIRPPAREVSPDPRKARSEEHTSELQSQSNLVCRLLLEKKKKKKKRKIKKKK